jgi:hypothetical protein
VNRTYPELYRPWIIENNWLFRPDYAVKVIALNGLGFPELSPNPTESRTHAELCRVARIQVKGHVSIAGMRGESPALR